MGIRLGGFCSRSNIILLAEERLEGRFTRVFEERDVHFLLGRLWLLCVDVINYLLLLFRVLLGNHQYFKCVVQLVSGHTHILGIKLCGYLVVVSILH